MKLCFLPGLFACMCAFASTALAASDSKPNILLILADDLGYQDLGYQGSPDIESPHIDRLATNGIRFTDGYVSASVCSPSRAGLMTGRYQQRFGHESNVPPIPFGMDLNEATLGQKLQQDGYRTGIVGKWHLGNLDTQYPTARGFDWFYGLREGSRSYFYDTKKSDKPGNFHGIEENGQQVAFDGYLTDVMGEKAIEFIESPSEDPFFLFLSFTAPHGPMEAKPEDLKRFDHIEDKKRRTYAAMIWAMDRAIGNVLDTLETNGMADNTLIWFLSDNGGASGNASVNLPLAGFKGIKFEGGIRVPFFLHWKQRFPEPAVFEDMVSALDILPTCVAAAGGRLESERPLDGVNLMPFLEGQASGVPHQTLFWHKLWFSAMRDGPWKLMWIEDYGYALYHLEDDPSERHDLSKSLPERVERMAAQLDAWKAEMPEPLWSEKIRYKAIHSENHIRIINGAIR